ncbi:MAG: DUF2505 family protein [Microthrixaceae bacterium]|nr:DUF2505 family protein [Microthrixaceae bacterium]
MRFSVTQTYPTDRDEVLELYTGTEMWPELSGFTKVSAPEVVDRTEAGSRVTVRLRYRFVADLPAAATAVINPRKLAWVEETVTDLDRATATVAFRPEHYAEKLSASARVQYLESGGSTTRRVQGDLKVNVFLVGQQVEKAIVSGLSEHLAEEERSVLELLAR